MTTRWWIPWSHLARDGVWGIRRLGAHLKHWNRIRYGPGFRPNRDLIIDRKCSLVAGRNVSLGQSTTIMADVVIGDDVMVSSRVAFIGNDHPYDASNRPITSFPPREPANIVLEGDNLIGFETIIMGDVRVGRGAIIGAGSLVTNSIPPDVIAVGRPAKPVARRRPEQ